MPLARIVTRTPAQLAALSEYLRARGYTVELIEPGTLRTASAELELDVDGCTAEEAMSRGMSAAEAAQDHGGRRAIAYDITGRPVAFADEEQEAPAERGNPVGQAWNGLRFLLRELVEDLRRSAARLRKWLAEGRETIQEHRVRRQEERRQAQAEEAHARQAQALAQQQERSRREQETDAERRALAERSRLLQEEAARQAVADRARREQEEAARRAELAAARERIREQQEQARRQEQAERERRLMERFRREARRDAVQERFQVEQSGAQQQPPAPAEARLARGEERRPQTRYDQRRDHDWQKAALAAVVIALLVTLGYAAYANRQPAAPLSNRARVRSQNVSQPVPFGTATVPPPQPAAAAPPRALPQSEVAPTAAPAPSPRVHRTGRARVSDDTIADDEVVIHRSATAARPSRTAAGATPKHISDLEQ